MPHIAPNSAEPGIRATAPEDRAGAQRVVALGYLPPSPDPGRQG